METKWQWKKLVNLQHLCISELLSHAATENFYIIDKSLQESVIRWLLPPGISWVSNCSVKDEVGVFDSVLEQLFSRSAVLTNDIIVTILVKTQIPWASSQTIKSKAVRLRPFLVWFRKNQVVLMHG